MTELAGWGRTPTSGAAVHRPLNRAGLGAGADEAAGRGTLARGLGRSYGDAALNAGGRVLDTTAVAEVLDFDDATGTLRVAAGASLDTLMRLLVPRGWFVPVSPGTRQVTVGGAIASDIHGKNHHRSGSWCDHVSSLSLATPAEGTITVGPDRDPEAFWATAGGMGLTGIVTEATVRCSPVGTSRLSVDTDRCADLDEVMALMTGGDDAYPYSVAWIDPLARGAAMGRGVLTRGRFARPEELTGSARRDPLAFEEQPLLTAPPGFPPGLLSRVTVRAFNEVWYRKAPRRRRDELWGLGAFFHPLDLVGHWNRAYGPHGFLQWQCVVPDDAAEAVRAIVGRLSDRRCPTFVNVLKRFGPGNAGHLSFPIAGWTLSVDIPVGVDGLAGLLDELDDVVATAGGRIYLAKDARMRPEHLATMYPRLGEWREVRTRLDPEGRFQSDLGRRLGLC